MKSIEIAEELKALGVGDTFSDSAQGNLSWIGIGPFKSFSDVAAIRVLADWEVSAIAHGTRVHTLNLNISIDEGSNSGVLSLGLAAWEFSLNSQDIRVINSAPTGELLIKFNRSVSATRYREPITMAAGSYIAVQDGK